MLGVFLELSDPHFLELRQKTFVLNKLVAIFVVLFKVFIELFQQLELLVILLFVLGEKARALLDLLLLDLFFDLLLDEFGFVLLCEVTHGTLI